MDIINRCLSLAPVLHLVPAFAVLRFIWLSVQQAQAGKQQLQTLAQTIAQLLWTLNQEYSAGRLREGQTSTPLDDLHRFVSFMVPFRSSSIPLFYRLLENISAFIEKAASSTFLRLLFTKDRRISRIEGYYNRVGGLIDLFQVGCDVFETASFIDAAGGNRYQEWWTSVSGRRGMMKHERWISRH